LLRRASKILTQFFFFSLPKQIIDISGRSRRIIDVIIPIEKTAVPETYPGFSFKSFSNARFAICFDNLTGYDI